MVPFCSAPVATFHSALDRAGDRARTGDVRTLDRLFGINASKHTPQDVHTIETATFDMVISIDNPATHHIEHPVRDLGIPLEQHLRWKILDPWDEPASSTPPHNQDENPQNGRIGVKRSHNNWDGGEEVRLTRTQL